MMPFKIVRPASVLAAALTLAALGAAVQAGTINSNLQIEPGRTFELGGGQEGGFTVTGQSRQAQHLLLWFDVQPDTGQVFALHAGQHGNADQQWLRTATLVQYFTAGRHHAQAT